MLRNPFHSGSALILTAITLAGLTQNKASADATPPQCSLLRITLPIHTSGAPPAEAPTIPPVLYACLTVDSNAGAFTGVRIDTPAQPVANPRPARDEGEPSLFHRLFGNFQQSTSIAIHEVYSLEALNHEGGIDIFAGLPNLPAEAQNNVRGVLTLSGDAMTSAGGNASLGYRSSNNTQSAFPLQLVNQGGRWAVLHGGSVIQNITLPISGNSSTHTMYITDVTSSSTQ